MNDSPFIIVEPKAPRAPFVLSLPHCGTEFPDTLIDNFVPDMTAAPDDTDWYLDKIYDFAPALGITTIIPKYSRWVIDLNREPTSKPLYDDGRIITALCPTTDFRGTCIYKDSRKELADAEIEKRLGSYFWPYHQKIDELCRNLASEFGDILFWDGHSIRRSVPTIQEQPFPDFILGDNDGGTADVSIIECALHKLTARDFDVAHNRPFKGGFLTRSKGSPGKGVHALQLEMSKDLYMANSETSYSPEKAVEIKRHLKTVFEALIEHLTKTTKYAI